MINNFAAINGSRLLDSQERFYMSIYGVKGASMINVFDYTEENNHLCFHNDYDFYYSNAFYSIEDDRNKAVLIVFYEDNLSYLYSNEEDNILFTEEKPEDPIYIEPLENQLEVYNKKILFVLRNNRTAFQFENVGGFLQLGERDHGDKYVVQFVPQEPEGEKE